MLTSHGATDAGGRSDVAEGGRAREHRFDSGTFRWPGGKLVAVALLIGYEGWSPGAAPPIGPMGNAIPPGTVDPAAAQWASYGPRKGIWRMLQVLGRHQVHATLATSGIIAAEHPESVRVAASSGHEIACHSWAQDVLPVKLSEQEERENIRRTAETIEKASGFRARGWVSPGASTGPRTIALLAEAGLAYHLHNFDDDLPYLQFLPDRPLAAIPFNADVNDLVTYVRHGHRPRAVLDRFADALHSFNTLGEAGVLPVTVHTHIFGRPGGAAVLDELIGLARTHGQAWIATLGEIADHCTRQAGQLP